MFRLVFRIQALTMNLFALLVQRHRLMGILDTQFQQILRLLQQ
jgi:hypothetical protein